MIDWNDGLPCTLKQADAYLIVSLEDFNQQINGVSSDLGWLPNIEWLAYLTIAVLLLKLYTVLDISRVHDMIVCARVFLRFDKTLITTVYAAWFHENRFIFNAQRMLNGQPWWCCESFWTKITGKTFYFFGILVMLLLLFS